MFEHNDEHGAHGRLEEGVFKDTPPRRTSRPTHVTLNELSPPEVHLVVDLGHLDKKCIHRPTRLPAHSVMRRLNFCERRTQRVAR